MILFVNSKLNDVNSKVVIPFERVFNIWASGCNINISYDSGEFTEVEGNFLPKIEILYIHYNNADEVNKIIRQFYKACNDDKKAFYFGK